jgi:hypothetical protein
MKQTEAALMKAMDSLVIMNTKLLETVASLQKQIEEANLNNMRAFLMMQQKQDAPDTAGIWQSIESIRKMFTDALTSCQPDPAAPKVEPEAPKVPP